MDGQFSARDPFEVLLQQSLRIELSDLLASHFSNPAVTQKEGHQNNVLRLAHFKGRIRESLTEFHIRNQSQKEKTTETHSQIQKSWLQRNEAEMQIEKKKEKNKSPFGLEAEEGSERVAECNLLHSFCFLTTLVFVVGEKKKKKKRL